MVRGNGRDTPRRAGVEPHTGKGRTQAPGSWLLVFLRESLRTEVSGTASVLSGEMGGKVTGFAHLYGGVHSSPTLHWTHVLTSPVF